MWVVISAVRVMWFPTLGLVAIVMGQARPWTLPIIIATGVAAVSGFLMGRSAIGLRHLGWTADWNASQRRLIAWGIGAGFLLLILMPLGHQSVGSEGFPPLIPALYLALFFVWWFDPADPWMGRTPDGARLTVGRLVLVGWILATILLLLVAHAPSLTYASEVGLILAFAQVRLGRWRRRVGNVEVKSA